MTQPPLDLAEGRRLLAEHERVVNDDPLGRWIFLNIDGLFALAGRAQAAESERDALKAARVKSDDEIVKAIGDDILIEARRMVDAAESERDRAVEALSPLFDALTAFPYDADEGDDEEVEVTITRSDLKRIEAIRKAITPKEGSHE